jgi:Domain of unknown function (DUF4167)
VVKLCALGNGRHLALALLVEMRIYIYNEPVAQPPLKSEIVLDQGPPRKPFRPTRSYNRTQPQSYRPANQRPPGIRPPGNVRNGIQNARNNYERYTTMAKDAARRGDVIEAENCYQHAEHYFRVMREEGA